MIWQSEAEMKKYVGLKKNNYLDPKYIGNIEKAMVKFKINVSGDVVRKSSIKTPFKISLILFNNKYSLKNSLRLVKRIAYEEKFPIIFHPDRKDDNINVYVHNKKAIMKKAVFDKYRKCPLSVKGILVITEDKKKTLKENYETFIEEADALKEATNGVINKYKTGRSS